MPIRTSDKMFSGGAVVFDTQPNVNMYAQLMARRQALNKAKEDAFDEYIRGMNTKINAAGHRTVDNKAFMHFTQKWTRYGIENKDKLLKNDIEARTEFNRLYQEALNVANESKDAEEEIKPVNVNMADRDKRNKYSANVIPAIASHNEPLYNEDGKTGEFTRNKNRKKISDNGDSLFNPELDFGKEFSESWAKGMVKGKSTGVIVSRDKITGTAKLETTNEYTPKQIKQISLNAAQSAAKGGKNNNYYQLRYEQMYKDPAEADRLNGAFQSVYGKEIKLPNGQTLPNLIDSPEEVAAAEAILQAEAMTEKGTKDVSDFDLKNQAAIFKIQLNDANIRSRSKSGGIDGEGDFDIVGNYGKDAEKVVVNERVGGTMFNQKYEEKTEYRVYMDNIPDYHQKYLGDISPKRDPKNGKEYYQVLPNNDWQGQKGTIKRVTVEKAYREANTSLSKRTGLSDDGNNPPPKPPGKETVAEKMRRLADQK